MLCCCQIWGDILIPLISAIIGGALTFLGVFYTIKKQEEKEGRNEQLKYKPYLKISQNKCKNEICCKDYIKDTFDQDNIDFEKTKGFYTFRIETFYINNSNNAECILKSIIIDDQEYQLNEYLLSNNECVGITTTRTICINIARPIKIIYLKASDLLGNLYYYECEFKSEFDKFPCVVNYDNGNKLNVYNLIYTIINIGLPTTSINK